jgi:uncharacterized membrane protein YfcA
VVGIEQLILFMVALVANIFSAFSGGGAGLIQLPVLIFLGLPFAVALATHKVASVALGIGATIRHLREGALDKGLVTILLVAGLPGVLIGANLIVYVPDRTAEISLGVLTLGLGVYSWLQPGLGLKGEVRHRDHVGYVIGGLVLFWIGILNGSLTSGTGLFVTLWLVRWFGLDYRQAVAYTLVLVGVFWNGAGAITLGVLSEIRWVWLPALLAGSLLGGYLGAHLAIIKGNRWIKPSYELLTVLIGAQLIVG